MIDPKMLRITQVNQAVVAAPRIGMNHGFNADSPANNGLQRFLLNIRNDFSKDFSVAFVNSKDNGFTRCAPSAFAFDTTCAKVRLVNFNFPGKRSFALIVLSQAKTNFQIDLIDRFMSQSG